MQDESLIAAANDSKLGMAKALAIEALAARALVDEKLLDAACSAIASERKIGFHVGMPLGWLAADKIFLSGESLALRALLLVMAGWHVEEQADLVRHWAGNGRLGTLTAELSAQFGWQPRYKV